MNDLTLHRLGGDQGPSTTMDYHNLPSSQLIKDQPTFWERVFPREKWTQITISWSVLQFIVISILEGFILKTHYQFVESLSNVKFPVDPATGEPPNIVPNSRALIVYQALFICAQAFQLFLCLDAIYSLSVIQLASTALFNFALFVYSIIQYTQAANLLSSQDIANLARLAPSLTPHPTKFLEFVVIGLMCIFAIGWAFLAVKLYKVFGWTIYKELGADVSVMSNNFLSAVKWYVDLSNHPLESLRIYHIYLMLLKLDVFFFFGFDIQFLVLVLINQQDDINSLIIHAAVAIPLSMILLAVAYYAVTCSKLFVLDFNSLLI